MKNIFWPFKKITRLSRSDDLKGFDCGINDFNDFIQNDALVDQEVGNSVTYIGHIKGRSAAFISLVSAAFQTRLIERAHIGDYHYRQVPAIKIARLATEVQFQKQGCGTTLLEYSLAISKVIKEFVGCRLIVTDALCDKIEWYRARGFILSIEPSKQGARENNPMYQFIPRN